MLEEKRREECDLSIIVPCLNEAENVEQVVENILTVIDKIPNCTSEIIVIDDQSEDETFEVAFNFINKRNVSDRVHLLKRQLKRRGYGAVVRHGVAHAYGRYAIFVSADMVIRWMKNPVSADKYKPENYFRKESTIF